MRISIYSVNYIDKLQQQEEKMGTSNSHENLEYYAIALTPVQSVAIFGYSLRNAKKTLTWGDIVSHPSLTLRRCVEAGVPVKRLCHLQGSLQRWVELERVTLKDYALLEEWNCDPFAELQASIADLILLRAEMQPKQLAQAGVTYTLLKEKHGMSPDLMFLLRYSFEEWRELGFTREDLGNMKDEDVQRTFGSAKELVMKRFV